MIGVARFIDRALDVLSPRASKADSAIVRVETIGGCVLYLGDCLSIIPQIGEIDCTLGDPPYSSGGFTQAAIGSAKLMGIKKASAESLPWFAGDNMTAAGGAFLVREVAFQCFQKTKTGGTLTLFTDWRVLTLNAPAIESALWRFQNLLVWEKGFAGMGRGFRPRHELAMHFSKGTPNYQSHRHGNVLNAKRVARRDKHHHCEKPVELLSMILETVAPAGGIVLDPFMGSGSTLVACAQRGLSGIGIECDPVQFDIACQRVRAAYEARAIEDAGAHS